MATAVWVWTRQARQICGIVYLQMFSVQVQMWEKKFGIRNQTKKQFY